MSKTDFDRVDITHVTDGVSYTFHKDTWQHTVVTADSMEVTYEKAWELYNATRKEKAGKVRKAKRQAKERNQEP